MSLSEEEQEAVAEIKRLLDAAVAEPAGQSCTHPHCPHRAAIRPMHRAANDVAFCPLEQDCPMTPHSDDKNGANLCKVAPFILIFVQ